VPGRAIRGQSEVSLGHTPAHAPPPQQHSKWNRLIHHSTSLRPPVTRRHDLTGQICDSRTASFDVARHRPRLRPAPSWQGAAVVARNRGRRGPARYGTRSSRPFNPPRSICARSDFNHIAGRGDLALCGWVTRAMMLIARPRLWQRLEASARSGRRLRESPVGCETAADRCAGG
jgi:hypothetical protein